LQDATDFGKIIRKLMVKNNLRQEQLAKELEVSPSILSNYITGKNIPEMDFLAKCVKKFNLKNKDVQDLFFNAFLSSASNNQKVVIDTRYIAQERYETLAKSLAVLLLYPEKVIPYGEYDPIDLYLPTVGSFFNKLEKIGRFSQLQNDIQKNILPE